MSERERRFPVFYLHDGQNLFDPALSYVQGHTWRAHETADELTAAGIIPPVILVGIAHTGLRRMAEYTPTRDFKLGGGEGHLYAQLLLKELKPWIDEAYRTQDGREDTAVGGSSLGGLITLEIGMEYPEIFGKLAVMSPSLWWDQKSILQRAEKAPWLPRPRIWLDMGELEGARHLRDADRLAQLLREKGWGSSDLHYERVPEGTHSEDAWAARFGRVLRFLFGPQMQDDPAFPDGKST